MQSFDIKEKRLVEFNRLAEMQKNKKVCICEVIRFVLNTFDTDHVDLSDHIILDGKPSTIDLLKFLFWDGEHYNEPLFKLPRDD